MQEPGQIENGVLFGTNEYLFLSHGGHFVLDYAIGVRQVPTESFGAFEYNVASRFEYTKQRGIKYLHLINPDKQSVMSNYFPYSAPICLGDLYLQNCPSVADLVYYPKDFLQRCYARGTQTFLKTDTHLTNAGSIAISASILERLQQSGALEFRDELMNAKSTTDDYVGDLGGKLTPRRIEQKVTFRADREQYFLHNGVVGGNNGIVDIYFTKRARSNAKLLIFGDSFGRELCKFLSLFYFQSVFLRTPYFHGEIIDAMQPDIVITQNVERYLDYCSSDDNRPLFIMYPHLSKLQYSPSLQFAEAFSALCSYGRAPYTTYLAKIGFLDS
jgi:hypothetical protein